MTRALSLLAAAISSSLLARTVQATASDGNGFVVIGGQIFTPGLAIVDAPQPYTPLGGDFLQVALDVSGDGKLGLPPYAAGAPTQIRGITMFLTSYVTGLNLTISNGTAGDENASLGDIMAQENGSTVKHVNWVWPDCLVGDGKPTSSSSSRGSYNISIHQTFLLNATAYYTIFALPISVTNRIDAAFSASNSIALTSTSRPLCAELGNPLVGADILAASGQYIPPSQYPFTAGGGVTLPEPVQSAGGSGGSTVSTSVGGGSSSTLVNDGSSSTPVGVGSSFTPMSVGGSSTPVSVGSTFTPVAGTSPNQSPYALGSEKPDATTNDPLGDASRLTVHAIWIWAGFLVAVGMG